MTRVVPPSRLTGIVTGLRFCLSPTNCFLAPCRRSNGPGVDIPNTVLGASRRLVDVVTPLTSSSKRPCSKNLSAIGCTGLLIFSIDRLFSNVFVFLFTSATGRGCVVSYFFLSASEISYSVDPPIAGIM